MGLVFEAKFNHRIWWQLPVIDVQDKNIKQSSFISDDQ